MEIVELKSSQLQLIADSLLLSTQQKSLDWEINEHGTQLLCVLSDIQLFINIKRVENSPWQIIVENIMLKTSNDIAIYKFKYNDLLEDVFSAEMKISKLSYIVYKELQELTPIKDLIVEDKLEKSIRTDFNL